MQVDTTDSAYLTGACCGTCCPDQNTRHQTTGNCSSNLRSELFSGVNMRRMSEIFADPVVGAPGRTVLKLPNGGSSSVELIETEDGSRQVRKTLLIPGQYVNDPEKINEYKARFYREIDLLNSLRSPGVVRIISSFEYRFMPELPSLPAYTMPMAQENLEEAWIDMGKNEKWEENKGQYLALLYQAAIAIAYVHAKGIVHRDVKPKNFLLPNRNTIWLCDFGTAKNNDDAPSSITRHTTHIYTPGYVSPEQAMDLRNAIPASDVYSFGATVMQLATGKLPSAQPSDNGTALKSLDDPIAEFVGKCIEFSPSERFTDGSEMVLALRSAIVTCQQQGVLGRLPLKNSHLESIVLMLEVGDDSLMPMLSESVRLGFGSIEQFVRLFNADVLRTAVRSNRMEKLLEAVRLFNEKFSETQAFSDVERVGGLYELLFKEVGLARKRDVLARLDPSFSRDLAATLLNVATRLNRFDGGRSFIRLFCEPAGLDLETLRVVLDADLGGADFIANRVNYDYIPVPAGLDDIVEKFRER